MTNFPRTPAFHAYRPACLLRATGDDVATFLQGQFSNDLGRVDAGQAVYGLWLDRKGRVVADSHVLRAAEGGGYWIASVSSAAIAVRSHLEAHIIADDVAIEDATPGWSAFAVLGAGAGAWLGAEVRPGLRFPGRRSPGESWEWLFPEASQGEADAAAAGAARLSALEIARLRIEAGIPLVPQDIGPADLPQEGGLGEAAVSYSKGCYLGQEVMARLKAMGRVRRELVRVAGDGEPPRLPADLWLGERREGELRSAAAGGQGFTGLALVQVAAAAAGAPLSLSRGGPASVNLARK